MALFWLCFFLIWLVAIPALMLTMAILTVAYLLACDAVQYIKRKVAR